MGGLNGAFIEALAAEPPFSYPEAEPDKAEVLVGSQAKVFERDFRTMVLDGCRSNSMMSGILGPPGSGKTQFINHMALRSRRDRKETWITIVVRPTGEELKLATLLQHIAQDETLGQHLRQAGIEEGALPPDPKGFVNQALVKLKAKGQSTGLLIAVDNVDEHIRQGAGLLPEEEIRTVHTQKFLGIFRSLIGNEGIPAGLCVLFALTRNAYDDVNKALSDNTLKRRFTLIHDPLTDHERELGPFTEQEAYEMVDAYMGYWARSQKHDLPEVRDCTAGKLNLYPFHRDAIRLFWEAGKFPGAISYGCKLAINLKLRALQEGETTDVLIGPGDAAEVIARDPTKFLFYDAVKDKVKGQYRSEELQRLVKESANAIRSRYDDLVPVLRERLEPYVRALGREVGIEANVGMGSAFGAGQILTADFVITVRGKSVGIKLINGSKIEYEKARPLIQGLQSGVITHGLFVCLTDAREAPGFGEYKGQWVGTFFEDIPKGINFKPVVTTLALNPERVCEISAVADIDEGLRPLSAQLVDSRAQLLLKLQVLITAKAGRLAPPGRTNIDRPE